MTRIQTAVEHVGRAARHLRGRERRPEQLTLFPLTARRHRSLPTSVVTVATLGLGLALIGALGSSSAPTSAIEDAPPGEPTSRADEPGGPVAGAPSRRVPAASSRPTAHGIAGHIRRAAARYGVSESLLSAIVSVESRFDPRAVSPKGARGLMQLMPELAAVLGVRDAFDPAANVDAGARHLRDLLARFDNDLTLTLAAWNAGIGAVLEHGGVPPYPETRAFVARVLRLVERRVQAPAAPPAKVRLVARRPATDARDRVSPAVREPTPPLPDLRLAAVSHPAPSPTTVVNLEPRPSVAESEPAPIVVAVDAPQTPPSRPGFLSRFRQRLEAAAPPPTTAVLAGVERVEGP
jgi:hypothetical protein